MAKLSLKNCPLWKWVLFLVLGGLFFFFVYASSPILGNLTENVDVNSLGFFAASAIMLGLYWGFVKLFEHRNASELDIKKLLPHSLYGILIGALFMSAITGILYALSCYKVIEVNTFFFDVFVNYLFFYLLVAVGEEVVFRGFLYRYIRERYGLLVSLIVSSIVFGFVHIANDNATVMSCLSIAVEAGLLLGVAYEVSQSLWLPIGLHLAWNFVQGVVYGFPVSGNGYDYTVLIPEVTGSDILTGGMFGPEASIFTAVLGLLLSILLLAKAPKSKAGK